MRDAKLFQIYEGTSQIQRLVIAKEIFMPPWRLRSTSPGASRFVTGGSRGLGRADALDARAAGADVVVADLLVESQLSRGDRPLRRARDRRAAAGPRPHRGDGRARSRRWGGARSRCAATSPTAARWTAAVARTVEELGSVDILVNNAGTLDHAAQFRRPVDRAVGARPARQPHRRVQLRAGSVAAHEGTRLGADRQHGVRRGDARRLRAGELLDDEGGTPRPHEDARDGGRPARDHVQRDRAGRDRHRGLQHGERRR